MAKRTRVHVSKPLSRRLQSLILFLLYAAATPAQAHPLDLGLLNLSNQGQDFTVSLELNPAQPAKLLGVSPNDFSVEPVSRYTQGLFQKTLGQEVLTLNGTPCTWSEAVFLSRVSSQNLVLRASAQCQGTSGRLALDLPFLRRLEPTFNLVVRANLNGQEHVTGADPTRTRIEISMDQAEIQAGLLRFVALGIEHIGAVPSEWFSRREGWHFPSGIDHILFVLALVLGGGGWLGILKTVTGFTVGHSITLALATLGVIRLPSRWVESAIALSIAIVAGEALASKSARGRYKIALVFGLVHGMGFASALAELHLARSSLLKALIGFNVGVELGQAVIVLISLPLLAALQRTWFLRGRVVPLAASSIFLAGSYWFVRRAFAF